MFAKIKTVDSCLSDLLPSITGEAGNMGMFEKSHTRLLANPALQHDAECKPVEEKKTS
jgi:hypothetical protein